MSQGTIDGREINALTINADIATISYTFDNGYKICLKPMLNVLRRVACPVFFVPSNCAISIKEQRTLFCVPSKRGCS